MNYKEAQEKWIPLNDQWMDLVFDKIPQSREQLKKLKSQQGIDTQKMQDKIKKEIEQMEDMADDIRKKMDDLVNEIDR